MKLKTLKDLEEDGAFRSAYIKDILKQEAIKWVKHVETTEYAGLGVDDWMKFFNITEEDLK